MKKLSLQAIRALLVGGVQSAGDSGDISGTLQRISAVAQAGFGADICVIVPINPITDSIMASEIVTGERIASQGVAEEGERTGGTEFLMTERVLRRGTWFVADRKAETEYQSSFAETEAIRSTAAVVLREEHDQPSLGVLYLHFRSGQHFVAEDAAGLEFFAEQASSRLRETWVHYHCREIEQIEQEINRSLAECEDLFRKLQMYIHRVLDTTYSLLLAVYPLQGHSFDVFVNEGERIIAMNNKDLRYSACQYAAETKKPIFIQHLSQEKKDLKFRIHAVEETGPKEFYIFLPLVLRDDTFGVLSIQ